MYYLAELFPGLRDRKLPLSRDQMMLLMAAMNEFFLGLDTYLAHLISGTIRPREWIPIIFGPSAGLLLLVAGLIALRKRGTANVLATAVMLSSIVVGLLGMYFHVVRAALPSAPIWQRLTVDLLVWAPPVVGPLVFSLVGLWGLSAAWIEDPAGSGKLRLLGGRTLRLPYSKTRAYLYMVSLGILATIMSSVLDHARTPFSEPWLWLPFGVGIFGVVIAAALAFIDKPSRWDIGTYLGGMVLLMVVGLIGLVLHIQFDLTSQSAIVTERFLRGAPFLAPMLFANMGMLGIIAIMDPREE